MSINEFKFNKETQTLEKYLGDEKIIVIPRKIDNVAVTHIRDYAFFDKKLTELHLPDSVTHIGNGAFAHNSITELHLPDSVKHIGNRAFNNNKLTKVYIDNTHVTIGEGAFSNNPIESFIIKGLTQEQIMYEAFIILHYNNNKKIMGYKGYLGSKFKIPEDITHIGGNAFENHSLTELYLPNSVTHIEDGAFYKNKLTKVYIENTHVTIGERAFLDNPIESFIIKGLTQEQIMHEAFILYYNNSKKIYQNKGYLGGKVKIPEDITHIGVMAFSSNSLTEIQLPNSVTHIESSAFNNNKLTELHLPDSVTHIENHAFSFNSITVLHLPDSVTHIEDCAFYNNKLTKVYIENTHVTIGKGAFSRNPIESFIIKGLTQEQIMKQAFIYDKKGKTITGYKGYLGDKIKIPENITHIEKDVFSSNSITELHLPNSVTHIGESAFSNNKLKFVIIGKNVKDIGDKAFSSQDNKLQRVTVLGDQTRFNDRWSNIGFPKKLMPKG
jgi:hypothetical protein